MGTLPQIIDELESNAQRLYSRWSQRAWRLACEGPALRLWDGLAAAGNVVDAERALFAYLVLLRESVGLGYLSASEPADLDARNEAAPIGKSFLALALCDALPRLLPTAKPASRSLLLAQTWNIGERLNAKPVWLNRYLAARLHELQSLESLEPFLQKVLGEGLDEVPASSFGSTMTFKVLDLARFDHAFLPGELHLATPSIACLHDRKRPDRQLAVLLRPEAKGGALCLGATPCLGREGGPVVHELNAKFEKRVFEAAKLPEKLVSLATRGGFLLYTTPLSQRVWVGEALG